MTNTTTTSNLSNLSDRATGDAASLLGEFLKEHGEVEMILPVALGVFITSRFQLRGANALLVNLLVASLARQIFTQLKQQAPQPVTADNSSHVNGEETTVSESNLQGCGIAHAVVGRVRLRLPRLATDADFARRLQQALNADEHVKSVRINRTAASIAINYSNQGMPDWELGVHLMNIINAVQQEHQVPQPMSS